MTHQRNYERKHCRLVVIFLKRRGNKERKQVRKLPGKQASNKNKEKEIYDNLRMLMEEEVRSNLQ